MNAVTYMKKIMISRLTSEKCLSLFPYGRKNFRNDNQIVNHQGHPLVGIAFPGRASILVNILGLTTQQVAATYEIKGSIKISHIPGTRIPILPEQELFTQAERPQVVFEFGGI